MTVGILSRSDSFNRVDGDIHGSTGSDGVTTWNGSTNIDIVSNEGKVIANSGGSWLEDSSQSAADGWVEFVFRTGTGHGPALRVNAGGGTGIFAFMNGTVRVYDTTTGLLTTGATTVSAGSRVALYASGSAIKLYVDDVLDGETTSLITSSGKFGIYGEVANATFDAWNVYLASNGVGSSMFPNAIQRSAWQESFASRGS